jgi:hypothetical protein
MNRFIALFAAVAAAGCASIEKGGDYIAGQQHAGGRADRPSASGGDMGGSMMKMMMMMPMSILGPLAGCAHDADPVPTRLSRLHDALKIGPAQETPWSAFAGAYERHVAVIDMDMSSDNSEPVSAPDRMRHEEAMMEADLSTLRVLRTSLEALYASLDTSQRSAGDALKCKMGMGHK